MLIALDGIDGSGKTTLSKLLYKKIIEKGVECQLYNMGNYGFFDSHLNNLRTKKLAIDPVSRELLYYFEGNLFSNEICKNPNKVYITDRYYLSYYAYGPINHVMIDDIEKFTAQMKKPDLYFFIDVKPDITLERIKKYRKIDPPEIGFSKTLSENEEENWAMYLEVQKEIYNNYKSAISNMQDIICIDGNRSIEEVFRQIISNLKL